MLIPLLWKESEENFVEESWKACEQLKTAQTLGLLAIRNMLEHPRAFHKADSALGDDIFKNLLRFQFKDWKCISGFFFFLEKGKLKSPQ